jgi:hypothetical protein
LWHFHPETAGDATSELARYVAASLMSRFRFSLHEIAEILNDTKETVSYATVRSWSSGKTLTIKPTMKVRGFARPCWGLLDLQNFVIAKRLLRHSGLPAKGIDRFLTKWASGKFLPSVPFHEKMEGSIILVADQQDASKIEIFFYPKGSNKYDEAFKILAKSEQRFFPVSLESAYRETIARLFSWVNGEIYVEVSAGEKARRALAEVISLKNQVDSIPVS